MDVPSTRSDERVSVRRFEQIKAEETELRRRPTIAIIFTCCGEDWCAQDGTALYANHRQCSITSVYFEDVQKKTIAHVSYTNPENGKSAW